MVARTPPKQKKMVAPLNPTLLRETVNKVEKCMARLQELQYTVTGGTKVIGGVSLSPRSTRGYLRTSLRCKQEFLRIKNSNPRKSPPGKFPTNTGEWRRMSLPAMLLGETVGEILEASQFAREIVAAVSSNPKKPPSSDDPKTPATLRRNNQRSNPENSELRARRKREKQITLQSIRSEYDPPSLRRTRSRINFKTSSPPQKKEQIEKENCRYLANRVSPRHKPWARKTVLFPNPLFHTSPTSQNHRFCRTKSPIIARNRETPHKFLIKAKSPTKLQVKMKSPVHSLSPIRAASASKKLKSKSPKASSSTVGRLRRSFSPSRLANRLVSPLKSRRSVQRSDEGPTMMMSGPKPRFSLTPLKFPGRRI